MHTPLKLALLAAVACALALPAAWADVPQNMNLQGRLTDLAGDPVAPGLKIFTFKIFDAASGGTEIWPAGAGEHQTLSTDADGLWNARVGENIPLTRIVFADTSRWLEVTVDDGINPAETLPRFKLNTNPWAHQAVMATTASNAITADHAITADDAINAGHAATADQAADAAMLDGVPAAGYAQSGHSHNPADITPQGPTSGLDADLLDGAELGDIRTEIDADVAAHSASAAHDSRYFTEGEADVRFVNTSGDAMSGILGTPHVSLGNVGQSGRLELYQNGTPSAIMVAAPYGSQGGYLSVFEESGPVAVSLQPDFDGQGGYFEVYAPAGSFAVDGSYAGSGAPVVSIYGTGSSMLFDTRMTDNAAVVLPRNAIDSAEIFDEPGIASANSSVAIGLNTTMKDLETVDITIPAGGYIVVEGDCTGRTYNTLGRCQGYVQIDQTAGGGVDLPHMKFFGFASHATTAGYNMFPIHVSRVYYKAGAGTYTFRLEAQANPSNDVGAEVSAIDPTLTAVYYPTSYGSVATAIAGSDVGEFPNATTVSTGSTDPTDPNAPAGAEILYQVDLRDLELKAARADAAAAQARRELLEARLHNGQPSSSPEQKE